MLSSNPFDKNTLKHITTLHETTLIQPVQIGQTDRRNELVFFIKPELLIVEDQQKILNSLNLIQQKFEAYKVTVHGTVLVTGSFLEEKEIMNRHYGFINLLSRKASEIVDAEIREQVFKVLEKEDNKNHIILGGHEFMERFKTDIKTLSDVWFGKGAHKLRSGFYFIEEIYQDAPLILVNGFHPSQLEHFTHKNHRILLMLLHTDTNWYEMKFDLVGDTFPEHAKPGSIRGMLAADPDKFGLTEVGINANGVHLSAGPFEAAFEVVNFFGALLDLDPETTPPLAIKRAHEAGFSLVNALNLLSNPALNDSDLFTATENLNTNEAVELIKSKTTT